MALNPELYRNWNPAQDEEKRLRKAGETAKADAMARIAREPTAVWVTNTTGLDGLAEKLERAGARTLVVVLYAIPKRDCGSASAGGWATATEYLAWIEQVCAVLAKYEPLVIVEPDALSVTDCLTIDGLVQRLATIHRAVRMLRRHTRAHVYLDCSEWAPAEEQADRLLLAGLRMAEGIALNVSLSQTEETCHAYAARIRELTGLRRQHVIDCSRNGAGPAPDGEWRNPQMLRIGRSPTLTTGTPWYRGALWVKTPGGSDGPFEGGPKAGAFWPEYALRLAGYEDSSPG